MTLCIVGGLGHGEHAETTAKAAVDYVADHISEPLADIFAGCDSAIHHTRGVAMGIALIDEEARTLTYAGIGDTCALIVGEESVRLDSNPGIVGGGYRRLSPEAVPLPPGALVIMYTDGLKNTTSVSGYDDGLRADLPHLAEKILQDWGRENDDAAVLVFRRD